MSIYKNRVEWRGEHKGFTWCQNGTEMVFSAPPDLFGLADVLTPEDAFMAAANTCYHMMVIWAMERFKIDLVSFECEAAGEVEEHIDRTSWFKTVKLAPRLVVRDKPSEVVRRALDMALKYSTICQSLKSKIVIQPTIIVQ
ncbi:OsmC family protein [uncultured Desulfobacterium sp.]|uniref:OsmC family protein n=1 Tax=uncultured Desulfobacterium sp. TaxID=201089 RepID=A0A445N3T7_9BACT|nr:OsmC family protein [uncultured Desulfobacterium sp.]